MFDVPTSTRPVVRSAGSAAPKVGEVIRNNLLITAVHGPVEIDGGQTLEWLVEVDELEATCVYCGEFLRLHPTDYCW